MSKFFGGGPGQNMAEVVPNLSARSLHTVLGPDVVSLLEALIPPDELLAALRRVATRQFRDEPRDLMNQPHIRIICLDGTPPEKLVELTERLNLPNVDSLRALALNQAFDQDTTKWNALLEFYGFDVSDPPSSTTTPEHERVAPEFGLFPHQRRVANQVYHAIRDGHGRRVLHMPTGTGKTRTAMHVVIRILAEHEPCVVAWLAASAELLEQAADSFRTSWAQLGNREMRFTRFWGQHSPRLADVNDGLVIAGFQKIHALNVRSPMELLRLGSRTRLVVVDEAHQSIATTYREVIETLTETGQYTALLGLTATPGRTWSDVAADEQLSDFFGERKVTVEIEGHANAIDALIEQGYMARPFFSRLEVEASRDMKVLLGRGASTEEYGDDVLDALATHTSRNAIIMNELRRLLQEGHTRIMFFGSTVRHAKLIASALTAIGIDARSVAADTSAPTRRRIIRAFRSSAGTPMVLCNFGVLTAGFDAPRTSACLIARPTRSLVLYSQMVGRATRGPRAGGNETCSISTVVDVDLPGFGDLTEAFANWEDVWK